MGEKTNISWCDHTFNPWIGCTKVSEGCAHCYAEAQDKMRFFKTLGGGSKDNPVSHWGKGAPRHRTSEANWKEPVRWNREAGEVMARIRADIGNTSEYQSVDYERPRVFCASLADWLDDEAPAAWLADLLGLIYATPDLDWLLLTKRPENWGRRMEAILVCAMQTGEPERGILAADWLDGSHPPNVWIGATVENQQRAAERIPHLLTIPARVRFLSCEPLLGEVVLPGGALCQTVHGEVLGAMRRPKPMLAWVIAGGESGPGYRAMSLEWMTSLADQCAAAGAAFFCKQDSGPRSGMQGLIPDALWWRKEFPEV